MLLIPHAISESTTARSQYQNRICIEFAFSSEDRGKMLNNNPRLFHVFPNDSLLETLFRKFKSALNIILCESCEIINASCTVLTHHSRKQDHSRK